MPPKKVNHQKKALQWVGTVQDIGRKLLGKKTARALGAGLNAGVNRGVSAIASPASFAKGGRVKKTGIAKVHKGEVVLNKKTTCALKHLLK